MEKVIATESVLESGKTRIVCNLCDVSFVNRKTYRRHLGRLHKLQVAVRCTINCVVCGEKFRNMNILHEHLQNTHSTPLKFVEETFYCEKDFQDWKLKIEKETLSSYVLKNKTYGDSSFRSNYACHRSGPRVLRQNRIRKMKSSGSIKTGSICPAFMRVFTETVDDISEIKVHFQSVHIGHEIETQTLSIAGKERENLAACLKLGISMDKILEQTKLVNSPLNRYSFLTRQHLHNIRRDFKIPLYVKNKNAAQKDDFEMSDNSNSHEDYHEIEDSNVQNVELSDNSIIYEIKESNYKIQEHEENAAITSLLLLQNHNYLKEVNDRKKQIVNQLKELQLRIEEWDPAVPLPDVEENIGAMNALFDISTSTHLALQLQGTIPVPSNAPAIRENNALTARKSFKNIHKSSISN